MSIKKKILSITIIPVLLLGIVSIFLTFTTVKGALINQIEEALKGTAAATLAAYDQNTGDYIQTSNGDIWKGSYNISKSESLVDRIKKNTDMDVTFFYGNERIMTSAADSGWKPHFRFTGGRCDYYKGSAKRRRIFQQKRIIRRKYKLWLLHAGLSEWFGQ